MTLSHVAICKIRDLETGLIGSITPGPVLTSPQPTLDTGGIKLPFACKRGLPDAYGSRCTIHRV